jgi:hypothetical protein
MGSEETTNLVPRVYAYAITKTGMWYSPQRRYYYKHIFVVI